MGINADLSYTSILKEKKMPWEEKGCGPLSKGAHHFSLFYWEWAHFTFVTGAAEIVFRPHQYTVVFIFLVCFFLL